MLYGKYNPVGKHLSGRNNTEEEKRRVERGDEEEEEKRRKTHELLDEGVKGRYTVICKLNLLVVSYWACALIMIGSKRVRSIKMVSRRISR
jgi:hypothetical protein